MHITSAATKITVRPAIEADLGRLTDIYNHYVLNSAATFDIEPFTLEQRAEWFEHYSTTGPHLLLVAEAAGFVVGSAWSSPYRPKRAYDSTVETSVYCDPKLTGQGVGAALYGALFAALADVPSLHRAVAGITLPNPASVRLHERFGFSHFGTLTEAGLKFGRHWDVSYWSKPLP